MVMSCLIIVFLISDFRVCSVLMFFDIYGFLFGCMILVYRNSSEMIVMGWLKVCSVCVSINWLWF